MMKNEFESIIYNLGKDFFNKKFNIPIYQRLYVWGEDQVKTLLEDLIRAYQHSKHHDEKHIYYLGGIVVVEYHGKFDLIDGQQRFTTLKILRDILGDTNLTLDFSIRENVWSEFKNEETENTDIRRMINAKRLLEEGLNNIPIDRNDFLNYIKEQVNLVVTKVPKNTDLNKLFELINGRGEQLQQHEILKAKILSHIKDEKIEYGKIWDICANMDDYLEISIKKYILKKDGEKLKKISWGDYFTTYKDLNINDLLENLKKTEEYIKNENTDENIKGGNSISSIINNEAMKVLDVKSDDPEDEASTQYLPIISFPLFLLYVLVSFKKDDYFTAIEQEKIEFKDKNLIQIFEIVILKKLTEDSAKKFIEYLFKFRKLFDKWIIRNHKDIGDVSNDTNHQINQIKSILNDKVTSRQIVQLDESRDLALLQSMLYHSHTRNTQEWIIPFLESVQDETCITNALKKLMNIDDYLYSDFTKKDTTVLRKSANYLKQNDYQLESINQIINHLINTPENYHYFSHYWFYKMDWILWSLSEKKDDKFRFTARNSIEHIGAQNPDDENIDIDKVSEDFKHSFGNLFLVSVSQNSSVGNKGFKTKIAMFVADKDVINLKLDLISEYLKWGDDGVDKHLKNCLKKVKEYYTNRN